MDIELTHNIIISKGFKLISDIDEVSSYELNSFILGYVPEMGCYWNDSNNDNTLGIKYLNQLTDAYYLHTGERL